MRSTQPPTIAQCVTSDSDLLAFHLRERSSVIFLNDVEIDGGMPSPACRASDFRRMTSANDCLSTPSKGPSAFAFELLMDPPFKPRSLSERSRQRTAVTAYPAEYSDFARQYTLDEVILEAPDEGPLDPRVSEIALGWSAGVDLCVSWKRISCSGCGYYHVPPSPPGLSLPFKRVGAKQARS